MWGAATAAYQIEGAAHQDGKGPSIWDVFSHIPGKTLAGDTGDVACDHYNRLDEDLAIMRELNLKAYRFSVSWARVLPQGRGTVNEKGLAFYDRLVDKLCFAGIEPFVTLYHWDLPAALQMELGGWANDDIAGVFADYAKVMFDRLGDRVKFWLTLNEPWCTAFNGYVSGVHAPGVMDKAMGYKVAHNLLRAHGHAVGAYRSGKNSTGQISAALNTQYFYPVTDSAEDKAAVSRAMDHFCGWFADPLFTGQYPESMRERLGALLPEFFAEDSALIKGSADFLGVNYYSSEWVRDVPDSQGMGTEVVPRPDLPQTGMDWAIVPQGFYDVLTWLRNRYGDIDFYITENGACFDDQVSDSGEVIDTNRIEYLHDHLSAVHAAINDGVKVKGYMAWSLLDNFEWSFGYSRRFGLVRCDYETLKRTIKSSGKWYANVIRLGGIDDCRKPAEVSCQKGCGK